MKPLRFFVLLVVILIGACGRTEKPAPAQSTPQPATLELTATPMEETALTTPTARVSPTVYRPPTWSPATSLPTWTPGPTRTPFPTHTPGPGDSPSSAGMAKLQPVPEDQVWQSPDGQWLWTDTLIQGEGDWLYHEIHIASADGKYEWRIQPHPEDIHRRWQSEVWYEPFFWLSGEHPYLFFVGRVCCADGVGVGHNMHGLSRLDLLSGEFSIQVPFTDKDYLFSFSPTGKYLLMEEVGVPSIQITRLIDAQVNTIDLPRPYEQAIHAYWAPGGKQVALWICAASTVYMPCSQNPVLMIDPEKPSYNTVVSDIGTALSLPEGTAEYCQVEWGSDTELVTTCGDKRLVYDVVKGRIEK